MELDAGDDVRRLLHAMRKFSRAEWGNQSYLGIKPSEMRVLLCIRDMSNMSEQRITVSEISKSLFITSPSVTQIIKSLCTLGYIERSVDAQDRRIADIRLTASGEQIVQKIREIIYAKYSGLIEQLGKEKSDLLITLLDQAYDYFDHVSKINPNG